MAKLTIVIDVPTKNQRWAYVREKMERKLRLMARALHAMPRPFDAGGTNDRVVRVRYTIER